MYSVTSSGSSTLSCNVGSTRLFPECPWIVLKCKNSLEEWVFKQYRNLFFCPPPFARQVIQSLHGHCEEPSSFASNTFIRSSNRTAPSSSRGSDASCRSNLIMTFDTAKQLWSKGCVSMTIHFLLRIGIETRDNVTGGFSCGMAFATGFPYTSLCSKATGFPVTSSCSKISRATVSDVSVTYLLIPFTIRTQETVLSRNRDSIKTSIP